MAPKGKKRDTELGKRDPELGKRGTQLGDWVEARGVSGQPARRGQIIELLGHEAHEHYRVRWDERHESILYPTDGVLVLGPDPKPASQ
jgi:hypothetical protein